MSINDQLLSKVLERDVNTVRQLLSEGADVNYINDEGEFALLLASKNGDAAIVDVLLNNGAQINLQDSNHLGLSALYEASSNGHVDVVELLLKHGANIDIQKNNKATPLFIACEEGHFKMAELLIEKGANVNLQMNDGQTTLLIAIDRGHEEVAKLLIKNGVQVDVKYEGAFPLYYASNRKWVEVVDMLIKNGAPIDAQYNGASSLYIASSKGHVEVAKVLLDNGAKVDLQYDGSSPLCIATWLGHIEVVKLLLERGAKVDLAYDSQSPLMIACQEGQTALAKVLLDHDADTYLKNNKGQTALEIAKEKNRVDIISLFTDLKEKTSYPGILFSEGVKKDSAADVLPQNQLTTDNLNYLDAYHKILAARDSLEMLFVKIIFLGPPRLGKTTARRRLTGEIADISSAAEPEQPSTGAVETGGNVVVRSISNATALMTPSEWSVMKDLTEEACMLLQFIYNRNMELNQFHVPTSEGSSKEIHTADKDEKFYPSGKKEKVHSDKFVEEVSNAQILSNEDSTSSSLKGQRGLDKPHGFTEIPKLFRNAAMNPKLWKDIKLLFRNSALLKMEDTGGQPEFMDMLPALTIGPALYLLFCKLIDDLLSRYTVSYHSPSSRESNTPVESTYTVEEVLLTALASISCFSSYSAISEVSVEEAHSSEVKEILTSSFKSVAYIVGTHRDLVSEEQIEEFDQQLQHSIRSTDFFREDLVQFSSEKRMILAIDNMNGGVKEIEKIRKFLERGIHQHFKKLRIPASWLVFSLCIQDRSDRIASLDDCHQLARQLDIPPKETKIVLWFLHHYAGVLMYFPDLPELKDTVICDTQIIYDSVTNLIINTFKFGSVSKCASESFRETGQFSLEDIRGATSNVSGDYIPLNQLVKLLEHLNIIAPIVHDSSHPFQTKPIQSTKYFMPCVLQNATCEELDMYPSCNPCLPASLMIRYKCGFVPLGIFPAVIAHLVGHSCMTLIEYNIKKNCVQFHYGTTDYDKVTLIYRTKYCEIHIEREHNVVTPTHEVCCAVREILDSTLKAVSSRMNYAFSLCYQLSFECPSHPGEDHLCVVDSKESIPHKMKCLKNGKNPQPVDMQSQHLVWFGKALTCSEGCTSASNLQLKDKPCDLKNVKNVLKDLSPKQYFDLGLELGIEKSDIEKFEGSHPNDPNRVLADIIDQWLRNNPDHSWDALRAALEVIDEKTLAHNI